MIETLQELIDFLKIYNPSNFVFRGLVGDESGVENIVAPNEYSTIGDIGHGTIANDLEYERRMSRFLINMMRLDLAQNEYLDYIGNLRTNNSRPAGFTDSEYYSYLYTKILFHKESSISLVEILQPLSIEPVIIYEPGYPASSMFAGMTYAGYYESTIDTLTGDTVSPARLGGNVVDETDIYYFRVKIQPLNDVYARLMTEYLEFGHVAGVKYEIELYYPVGSVAYGAGSYGSGDYGG
jgi:hypothetical protein